MINTGFIGGDLGYHVLRYASRSGARQTACDGNTYRDRSKIEALLGTGWRRRDRRPGAPAWPTAASSRDRCDFAVERFEAAPIKRLRRLSNALTLEFVTAMVRCELSPRPAAAERTP